MCVYARTKCVCVYHMTPKMRVWVNWEIVVDKTPLSLFISLSSFSPLCVYTIVVTLSDQQW